MLPKKKVTDEDIKATEARLAGSYTRFKQAVANIPQEAVRPVTDTVKAHPYATVAAAAGAGYLAFRLLDVLMPRIKVITSEVSAQPEIESRQAREKRGRSFISKLLSQAVSIATPYITAYVQGEVARLLSKPREGEAVAHEEAATEPEKVA